MKNKDNKYCNSLYKYERFVTKEVFIGNIPLGNNNPIRIQSMTNTDTLNTEASVKQCIAIFDAGADYVRLTVQTEKYAKNLQNIKDKLIKKGYNKPLIADVHFNAKIANTAAKIIEKVRINPGNYSDKKNDANKTYTNEEYNFELKKIEEKFTKLIKICKDNNTTLRIGSNHGSLSNRIIDRYGDTPNGMVESVLEFLRIANKNKFNNIVISLKSSNTRVMVFAYRLLMNQMLKEGMNFPIHLGVTEAGDAEDGRIKSAVGIGTMLIDGIGDTIRVSLTENPEKEIPVAKKIIDYITKKTDDNKENVKIDIPKKYFEYSKRKSYLIDNIGDKNTPVVIADLSNYKEINKQNVEELFYEFNNLQKKWNRKDNASDYIYIGKSKINIKNQNNIRFIKDFDNNDIDSNFIFYKNIDDFINSKKIKTHINFIEINIDKTNIEKLLSIKNEKNIIIIAKTKNNNFVAQQRKFIHKLISKDLKFPVIPKKTYSDDIDDFLIKSSCDFGALLIDGLIDGAIIINNKINLGKITDITFGIFQASRSRTFKTEYISCPSCGRTLFDIQEVTKEIKKRTKHLKGLKIGVMGCIVNGPGEMSDADYGYIGTGIDKVSLYKGQVVMKKAISSKYAVTELINLIKENNDWIEP